VSIYQHLLFGCTHGKFIENQHWKRCERVGKGRAGSCWVAQLMECPVKFAVKEVRNYNCFKVIVICQLLVIIEPVHLVHGCLSLYLWHDN